MSINLARASLRDMCFILDKSESCLRGSRSVAGLLIELNNVSVWPRGSKFACGSR